MAQHAGLKYNQYGHKYADVEADASSSDSGKDTDGDTSSLRDMLDDDPISQSPPAPHGSPAAEAAFTKVEQVTINQMPCGCFSETKGNGIVTEVHDDDCTGETDATMAPTPRLADFKSRSFPVQSPTHSQRDDRRAESPHRVARASDEAHGMLTGGRRREGRRPSADRTDVKHNKEPEQRVPLRVDAAKHGDAKLNAAAAGAGVRQPSAGKPSAGAKAPPRSIRALADDRDGDDRRSKNRGYVFTINLYEDSDDNRALAREYGQTLHDAWEQGGDDIKWWAFQVECGETGRVHIQGCIELANAVRFDTVRALFPIGFAPWIKKRKGSPQQAWDYCTKTDTALSGPWTKGDRPGGQGKRNDLLEFYTKAKELKDGTTTLYDLQEQFVTVEGRYTRYFDRVTERFTMPRDFQTHCILITGPASTGKTQTAHKWAQLLYASMQPYTLTLKQNEKAQQWWNGYEHSDRKAVIINEAEPNNLPVQYFNQMIDAAPFRVEIKGGMIEFIAKVVIITSNYEPDGLWPYMPPSVNRRIDQHWRVSYNPQHTLKDDATREDMANCAKMAKWTCVKGNKHPWVPALNDFVSLVDLSP